jgi:hypothetical protein
MLLVNAVKRAVCGSLKSDRSIAQAPGEKVEEDA